MKSTVQEFYFSFNDLSLIPIVYQVSYIFLLNAMANAATESQSYFFIAHPMAGFDS